MRQANAVKKLRPTPRPWTAECDSPNHKLPMALVLTGNRAIDCTGSGESYKQSCENATLIVRAVNTIDEAQAALMTVQQYIDGIASAALPYEIGDALKELRVCVGTVLAKLKETP